ncbi:MAG TPA: hypothetical protein PK668_04435 [Myxococcota bacterium]|nr:hypothetical protein [Myxococcota bacterium]HRY92107.1 hypothetical protein [Myxococcota bacterium]HSA20906.1 hypothetical protein [Myxococcota bacterium]
MDFWSDASVLRILTVAAIVLGLFAVYLIVIMVANRATRRLGESLNRRRPSTPPAGPPGEGSAGQGRVS